MDIRSLMQEMHNARTKKSKEIVIEKIKTQFNALNDLEKEEVKKSFIESLDEELENARKKLKEIDMKIEMMEKSKYISSKIA